MEKPKVTHLNEHIICGLCKGYLIEAITITTCLHSFCHSCIIKYLSSCQEEDKLFCPTCLELKVSDVVTITTNDLKSDHLLQTIVYKLVPFLYEEEQKRRKSYKKNLTGQTDEKKKRNKNGNFSSTFRIFCSHDVINVKISELISGRDENKNIFENKREGQEKHLQKCRYLLCPVVLKMSHLKKFILQKIYGGTDCNVILCANGKPLQDDLCLADVCYIFGLQKATCVSIKYVAYILPECHKIDDLSLKVQNNSGLDLITGGIYPQPSEKACEENLSLDTSDGAGLLFSHSGEDIISRCDNQKLQVSLENEPLPTNSPSTSSTLPNQALHASTNNFRDSSLIEMPSIVHHDSDLPRIITDGDQMNSQNVKHLPCDETSNIDNLALSHVVSLLPSTSSPISLGIPQPVTVPPIAGLNPDGSYVDPLADSLSETTMASPPNSPSIPEIPTSNPTKPCKVILCRLPTTCFMGLDRKRKLPLDIELEGGGKVSFQCKRKKLEDIQRKQMLRNLMTKYKKGLQELMELKKAIQQMKHRKVIQASEKVFENHSTNFIDQKNAPVDEKKPDLGMCTESMTVTTCTSCPTLITCVTLANGNINLTDSISSPCIPSANVFPEVNKSEAQNRQTIIAGESFVRKEDAKLSNSMLLGNLMSTKSYLTSPNEFLQALKPNIRPDFANARSNADILPPLHTDISSIFKYAKVCSHDKPGIKIPDSCSLISKCQDMRLPSNLDIIRVPMENQKLFNKVNYFQNSNAAIRSNHKTNTPLSLSSFVRPVQNSVINQVSEIENLKQILSALGNMPAENALSGSNLSTFDLMAYLNQNHSLMNSISIANQSFTRCFPHGISGYNSGIRQNLNHIRRQNVSTQTAQLELLNQYICRKSKPVHSVSVGRAKPVHFKRSFDHAFGSSFLENKFSCGPSKKFQEAYEGCFSKNAVANQFRKDVSPIYACGADAPKPNRLAFHSNAPSMNLHHMFTELASIPQGSMLKPLISVPHRVACLTPPTEMQKKQSNLNGVSERSTTQLSVLRPRSSSANAAEGYESSPTVMTSNNSKKIATAGINMTQPLTSHFLTSQISSGHNDPFYSIPRKNIFPIFSRSSKLHSQSLQSQAFCLSNKNGSHTPKEYSASQKLNQSKKFLVPISSNLHISGRNVVGVGMGETQFLSKVQDNNVTLDLSSKKSKTRAKHDMEVLKVDIAGSRKSLGNGTCLTSKAFARVERCTNPNIVANNSTTSSHLQITKLSTCRQIKPSYFKGILDTIENDTNVYSESPNIIDFRKSLPVSNFKLSELQGLKMSAIASTGGSNMGLNSDATEKLPDLIVDKETNPPNDQNCTKSMIDLKYSDALLISSKASDGTSTGEIAEGICAKESQVASEKCEERNAFSSSCIIMTTEKESRENCNEMIKTGDLTDLNQTVQIEPKEKLPRGEDINGEGSKSNDNVNNAPEHQEYNPILKDSVDGDFDAEKDLENLHHSEMVQCISFENEESIKIGDLSENASKKVDKSEITFSPESETTEERFVSDFLQPIVTNSPTDSFGDKAPVPDICMSSSSYCFSTCLTYTAPLSNDNDLDEVSNGETDIPTLNMKSMPTETSLSNVNPDTTYSQDQNDKKVESLERYSDESKSIGSHPRLHMEYQVEDHLSNSNEAQDGIQLYDSKTKNLVNATL